MYKIILGIGSILAALAVMAGAFATHSLKNHLSDYNLSVWDTASKYQMYHSLALLFVAILMQLANSPSRWLNIGAIAFMIGIVLFSGSLYVLSLTNVKLLGAITPVGGLAFIIGWICLAIFAGQSS